MRARYRSFLAGLRLRHFSPEEVLRYGEAVRGGVENTLPPERLWENLVPSLWVVDQLREHFGAPIHLTSIYRSPRYNAQVGGAAGSQHLRNAAIDFQSPGVSALRLYNAAVKLRQAGAFAGGIGRYSSFVHIDTRGTNATWQGS